MMDHLQHCSRIFLLICLVVLPGVNTLKGQEDTLTSGQIEWLSEKLYGTDDYIFQGKAYSAGNIKAAGHPFLHGTEWEHATVYSNNRTAKTTIKYDIEVDILVLRYFSMEGIMITIAGSKQAIDSFLISDQLFINMGKIDERYKETGYCEKLYEGERLFAMQYNKHFIKNFNTITPYGSYSKPERVLIIAGDGSYTEIPDRKSFLRYFSSCRSELKSWMRQRHIRFNKAEAGDIAALCRFASEISGTGK